MEYILAKFEYVIYENEVNFLLLVDFFLYLELSILFRKKEGMVSNKSDEATIISCDLPAMNLTHYFYKHNTSYSILRRSSLETDYISKESEPSGHIL